MDDFEKLKKEYPEMLEKMKILISKGFDAGKQATMKYYSNSHGFDKEAIEKEKQFLLSKI